MWAAAALWPGAHMSLNPDLKQPKSETKSDTQDKQLLKQSDMLSLQNERFEGSSTDYNLIRSNIHFEQKAEVSCHLLGFFNRIHSAAIILAATRVYFCLS